LGDHSETVQMDYDPATVSYEELLETFWNNHSPQYEPYSRQYASIIFYHTEEQRRVAEDSKAREEARLGKKVYTEIRPAGTFFWAEDYHQKYYLQSQASLMREYRTIYPNIVDFVNSTAVARANGYAGGYCPAPTL
jgi:peptide-methionine (S)-S-oxide reductase